MRKLMRHRRDDRDSYRDRDGEKRIRANGDRVGTGWDAAEKQERGGHSEEGCSERPQHCSRRSPTGTDWCARRSQQPIGGGFCESGVRERFGQRTKGGAGLDGVRIAQRLRNRLIDHERLRVLGDRHPHAIAKLTNPHWFQQHHDLPEYVSPPPSRVRFQAITTTPDQTPDSTPTPAATSAARSDAMSVSTSMQAAGANSQATANTATATRPNTDRYDDTVNLF